MINATTKLLTDLKKFGAQSAKNCKPEHLIAGYGEAVCHIIDELLNIELYRRDYQFHEPIFPPDDDEGDDEEEEGKDDVNLHGT